MKNDKFNRDKHYKSYPFRLDERTIMQLKKVKKETSQTWNMLFLELLFFFDMHKKNNIKYKPYAGKIEIGEHGKKKIIKLPDNH